MKVLKLVFLACGMALVASAGVILQNTAGTATATAYWGIELTTPATGPWENIEFTFYSNVPATTETAAGTAFLLSQAYAGTPAALSSSTPGFLAESTGITSNQWIFPASTVLEPGTEYWIYTNAATLNSGGNAFSGAQAYMASSSSSDFATINGVNTENFLLSGTQVPEPATFGYSGLLLLGFVAVGVLRQRAPGV